MGCCDCLGKTVLIIINIIFSLVGLALLVTGCVVRFGSDLMEQYLQSAYSSFQKALEEAGAGKVGIENLNIGDLVGDATLAFIIIGAFFFVVGVFGCVGACCKVKFLLVAYAIILIVVLIVEIVFVVLLVTIKPTVDKWLRDPVKDTLQEQYTGDNGTDAFTLAINFIMHNFDCCGIYNYTEFEGAKKWIHDGNAKVPSICCREKDNGCTKDPNTNNSFIGKGCFEAVEDWLMEDVGAMIGVGSGVAVIQLILIICAFVVCCRERKKNDDSYDEDDMPIQPYRENKNSYGDMFYQGQPNPGYRPDQGGHYPSAPSETEMYQGRTDYYRGPPDGYRAGNQHR